MAGARSSQVKDDKLKKRKREANERDSRSKRPRSTRKEEQLNGHLEDGEGDATVGAVSKLAQSSSSSYNGILQVDSSHSNDQGAGWRVSKPMGGRMLDIDPILTEDEKHLILTYNTSIQVYSVADSLLVRRIPVSTLDTDAPRGQAPAYIVATRFSKKNSDFVWVACSDGRVHHVNWTENTESLESFQTSSKTARAMAISQIKTSKGEEDVVLVLESDKSSRTEMVAYLGSGGAAPPSKSLLNIKKPGSALQLLESSEDGQIVVGVINDRVFVGAMSQQEAPAFDQIQYEFLSFDTPDLVSAVDLRLRTKKTGAKGKRVEPTKVVDVLIGGARGAIYVYHDVLAQAPASSKPSSGSPTVQTQKYHWHRKAVHSVKWSRDGNYIISGGSENTLVLWQVDTGKKDFLPHLSGTVENIVVSQKGSSYVVHLDDNSAMILSTAELRPTTYVSGIQSATANPLTSKDMLVRRTWTTQEHVRKPIPATINPSDPSKLHVCVGNGRQAILAGELSNPLLQSFDLESFSNVSRQPLARTQPTDVNTSTKGNPIDEPCVTHISFSADGKWFASVDDWTPPAKDSDNLGGDHKQQFSRERHESYLKFWDVSSGPEPLALVSRINAPHSTNFPEAVLDLASSPVSTCFATIGMDGVVRMWQPKTRQQDGIVAKGVKGQDTVTWACSHVIAVGDGLSQDIGMEVAHSTVPARPQGCLAFSEDGSTLFAAFGSIDAGAVHVIDTSSGEITKTLDGLWSGHLRALEFLSPFIVVLSDELRLFDVVGDEMRYGIIVPKIPDVSQLLQLAVDHKSGHFAVVIPVGETSSIGIFHPTEPEPLLVRSIPHRVISLVSTPNVSGFMALDDAAQTWIISEGSDPVSMTAARPLQDLDLEGPVEKEILREASPDDDAEMASDDEKDVPAEGEDVDMEDAVQPSVVPQHLLSDIFDATPAFAAPPIEDMFYKVASLLSAKPLTATELS